MNDVFKVKVGEFEGPLDLLLNLIEKRKLHINDVSLSQVTDDYINYVKALQEFSIPGVANFIVVASTLLLVKSKSLLPTLDLSEEEEGDIRDLEDRLMIYKKIRDLSKNIKSSFGESVIFEGGERKLDTTVFAPSKDLNLKSLISSIGDTIKNIPVKEIIPKTIVKKVVSLEEMIGSLIERVESGLRLSFKEFSKDKSEKVEVIVGFLAMLELVKQGAIDVVQENLFDDIHMETQTVKVPRYQ